MIYIVPLTYNYQTNELIRLNINLKNNKITSHYFCIFKVNYLNVNNTKTLFISKNKKSNN